MEAVEKLPHRGITPAGAGKTATGWKEQGKPWDHPRRCGENYRHIPPPHTRIGITPAGAGKTKLYAVRLRLGGDHPRRCGENEMNDKTDINAQGSPPQVRGKHNTAHITEFHQRITPAGAGKTACLSRLAAAPWDHPRRCGENLLRVPIHAL